WIVGAKGGYGGDTYPHAPGAGVTERVDVQSGTSTSYDGGFCVGDLAAGAAGAYTWSVDQNASDDWAVVVVELMEAGSGIPDARRLTQVLLEADVERRTPLRVSQVLLEVDLGIRVPLRVSQVLLEVDVEPPDDPPGSVGRIGAPRGQVAPWRYRRPGGGGSAAAAVHVGRVATHQGPPAHPRVLEPRLSRRDFTPTLATPGLSLRVERLSWRAMGGPHLATIRAGGDVTALWSLVEALRCPVEIFDPHGAARWWGYVAEVEVEVEGIALTASLDTMANRVAVAYAYSTGDAVGSRATTAWAQDDDSVLEFGTVERLESSSSSDSADATQLRDVTLARVRWPQTAVRLTPGAGAVGATLECRGWWDTLRWRHYDNPDVTPAATMDEVAAVVADVGEFFEGTRIDAASGVLVSPYEDGDRTAQDVIADLLARGSANDRRMLAEVTRERYLRLYEEPAAGSGDYLLLADGSLRDRYNRRLAPGECPVGVWARLTDVLPATLDLTRLTNPGLVMLDEVEWDESQQRIANIVTRVDEMRLVTLEAR
ncbi:MAG: hypothetical protein GX657_09240, partial [Chloroflexi bacterium]|nr:hypothetical protein [Chloroflexota bacterium]